MTETTRDVEGLEHLLEELANDLAIDVMTAGSIFASDDVAIVEDAATAIHRLRSELEDVKEDRMHMSYTLESMRERAEVERDEARAELERRGAALREAFNAGYQEAMLRYGVVAEPGWRDLMEEDRLALATGGDDE